MFNFDKQFFKKHQNKLLFIANKWYLRWLLGLNRLPKNLQGKKVYKITPQSIIFEDDINTEKLFTRPRFGEALAYNLSPFCYFQNIFTGRWVWRFSPVGLVGCLLIALYPKSIGGFCFFGTTTTYTPGVEAWSRKGNSTSWSTTRDATDGQSVNKVPFGHPYYGYVACAKATNFYELYWYAISFDTSGIDASATISAASLFTWITDSHANANFVVVQTSQATWNNVTTADFDQRGNTEGCTRITSFTNGAYKEWALNETARGWIARSGETKPATASASGKTQLGIRNGNKDIDNVAPTDETIYIAIQSSDYTGTDHDPYLSVTYSAGDVSSFIPKVLFI